MEPLPALQVYFDGACPICSREVRQGRKWDKFQKIQWVDIANPQFDPVAVGLDAQRIQQAMHARGADGTIYVGVDAFVQIMRLLPRSILTVLFLGTLKVPGMMWVARQYYRWFARNRYRLTGRCTPESCGIDR